MRLRLSLILLALLVTACGRPEGRWSVSQIDGQPYGPSHRRLYVEFAHGWMSAPAGCNSMRAPYLAFAGRLWWTHPVTETLLVCFWDPNRYEALGERLGRATSYERVGSSLILRTDGGRSLTLEPAPPAHQFFEGDWVAEMVTPSHGWQGGEARPWISFHNGVVTDSAGCVGRYRRDGERLAIDYQPTAACSAAIARTSQPHGPWFDEVFGLQDALFARMRVVGVAFSNGWVCSFPELIGADGMRVDLSPAASADMVPPSGWTLDGDWRQPWSKAVTVVFDRGMVTVTGVCRGRYSRFVDALTFRFPSSCQRRDWAETRPALRRLSDVSGPLLVDMHDYAHMSLDRGREQVFDFVRVMPPEMTRPHQSCD